MKKTWERPQLQVLIRSKAEENVLANCKDYTKTSGPDDGHNLCDNNTGCGQCSSLVQS